MSTLRNQLRFDAADATTMACALTIHALSLLVVLGLFRLARPDLFGRSRRLRLLLAVQPVAIVLAAAVQFVVGRQLTELRPFAHRAAFLVVPYTLHLVVLAAAFYRARRPPADLAADYGDPAIESPPK